MTKQFLSIPIAIIYAVLIYTVSPCQSTYCQPLTEVNAADYGFDAADATDALIAAINSGAQRVVVPDMGTDWIMNRPIQLRSNLELLFEPGVVVAAKEGAFHGTNDCLFIGTRITNISLAGYGAILRMRKSDYQTSAYTTAEWRHTVSFIDCNDVSITGLTLEDSGGDGIYLGSTANENEIQSYCKNIYIKDVVCDGHHRQGITVICAEDLLIEDSVFNNTSGTEPEAGIDIEPNRSYQKLINCQIRNCTFDNNVYGIVLYLVNLTPDSPPISVFFENCVVPRGNEKYGVFVAGLRNLDASGSIEFDNCTINTGTFNILVREKSPYGPPLVFRNCLLKEVRNRPILFTIDKPEISTINGGVEFDNCIVNYANTRPIISELDGPTSDISGVIHVFNPLGTTMGLGADATDITVQINEYMHPLPYVSSVQITPNSGTVGMGDTVIITAMPITGETGFTPSVATINGRQVPLTDQGDGTYRGVYTVQAGDAEGTNIEATGITLTDAGITSPPASSTGSTLSVSITEPPPDEPPVIDAVDINPDTGAANVGDSITITVTAANLESGLTPSAAIFNGITVTLIDQGNGTYTGTYTVAEGDPDAIHPEATGVTLTGPGGVSEPASSSGSMLTIDAHMPVISSVVLNPSSGIVSSGDVVEIIVTAENSETGLIPSAARFLGSSVPLADRGDGRYTGSYTIRDADSTDEFAEDSIFHDCFESGSTTAWSSVQAGIQVSSTARFGSYGISYDVQSTESREMYVLHGSNLAETYTSFFLRLAPDFAMNDGDMMYLNVATGPGDIPWALRLRRVGGQFQINATIGGNITDIGQWTAITPGMWHWIKIHHRSAMNGRAEWWLDGQSRGVYTGNTSTALSSTFSGVWVSTIDEGTTGIISWDHFQITPTDHPEPGADYLEASGITLADTAGNVSLPGGSSGSTLVLGKEPIEPPVPPVVASVTLTPDSGTRRVGGTVVITVTAESFETGLTPSLATFNGAQVALSDQGGGIYAGTYTVTEGDSDAVNPEATGITLTGPGGTSDPMSSTGSTLSIDANTPSITSVTISPSTGTITTGDTVTITVTAANGETGLFASNTAINGESIPLSGLGDGTYTGTYTVAADDLLGTDIEAAGVRLTDAAGNTSPPASSSGSSLAVIIEPPAEAPVVQSVALNPLAGILGIGDTITITVTAAGGETGLTASGAMVNGRQVLLSDQNNGTYVGTYFVLAGEPEATNIEAEHITLTGPGGTSAPAASSGSSLTVDGIRPAVMSVVLSPDTGFLAAGDEIGITITAAANESGLAISPAQINGEQVTLSGRGDGTYSGTYRVGMNDTQGTDIMAAGIILTDAAGNVSEPGSSTGTALTVDTKAPVIQSVTLSPSSGTVYPGNAVVIQVAAAGAESGLTPSSALFNGRLIPLMDQGGGSYSGTCVILATDIEGTNIEASGITLTDRAGNISDQASSSGSTLQVSLQPSEPPPLDVPTVASVTISPDEGVLKIGDTVTIMAVAAGGEAGLISSAAMFNGKTVLLTGEGDGTYTGIYTVTAGDRDGSNIEATDITLSNENGTSQPASSSGSSLSVDAHAPAIASVLLTPRSGWVSTGDEVRITVRTTNNESGLIASNATLNGMDILLADRGDGTYGGMYTVGRNDPQGRNIEATGITLTDTAGNVSVPGASSGSALGVDTIEPSIESVVLSPDSGVITVGDRVTITVTVAGNESGLVSLNAVINGRSIALVDQGDGSYEGVYVVAEADMAGQNIEATNIVMSDAAGNVSSAAASFGSTLVVEIDEPSVPPVRPVISSVTISPNTGYVKIGDMVTVTVVEEHGLSGLTPSEVTFNNRQLPLTDTGDGIYKAEYEVRAGDYDSYTVEAQNITLSGAGGVSLAGSSSGSTLIIDAHRPAIHSISLVPGEAVLDQEVIILVTAKGNEPNLIPSVAMVNGSPVPLFVEGYGAYWGLFAIQDPDLVGQKIAVTGISVADSSGNVSEPGPPVQLTVLAAAPPTGEEPGEPDTIAPVITSVTISPDSGWVNAGDVISVVVTTQDNEAGLIPSNARINDQSIPLEDQNDGTYTGFYTVEETDAQGRSIEAADITLTDTAGNVSQPVSSMGSMVHVDTIEPQIESVELSAPTGKILGVLNVGQSVTIMVTARDGEEGLIPSNALINGNSIPLAEEDNGVYKGVYTVGQNDDTGDNIEATGITLTDRAGNVSDPASSTESGLSIRKSMIVDADDTDFNASGMVDFNDFILFILAYGTREELPGWDPLYDLNADSEVNLDDFYMFVVNYGKQTSKSIAARVAAVAPASSVTASFTVSVDESAGMTYTVLSVSKPDSIHGLEFAVDYNPGALVYDEDSLRGLAGFSIPIFSEGMVRIASVFPDEEFDGAVVLGFRQTAAGSMEDVGLHDVKVIETDGMVTLPVVTHSMDQTRTLDLIDDLTVSRVSEAFAEVSWTVPFYVKDTSNVSGYRVELSHQRPDGSEFIPMRTRMLAISDVIPGESVTATIDSLAPGMPYYLALRPVNGPIIGSRSNIIALQTRLQFIDEDIDSDDPYITRDSDSLFIADNDRDIAFSWGSWDVLEPVSYLITVLTNGRPVAGAEAIVQYDTTFVHTSEPGDTTELVVKPVGGDGTILAELHSRSIFCAPADSLEPPGQPRVIVDE